MTVDELKKLWADFYGENMAVEYPAFYKKIKKLEKQKIKENEILNGHLEKKYEI
jgi:hypothetical protein|tara:strand:+ start:120 stop:281 length:162 start_codon:yes stop_codon:yes gene_type:complete